MVGKLSDNRLCVYQPKVYKENNQSKTLQSLKIDLELEINKWLSLVKKASKNQ